MQNRACTKVSAYIVIERIPGISDDPSDHPDSVMLEHTKYETTHCTTDKGFDAEIGDLLNATDGVRLR